MAPPNTPGRANPPRPGSRASLHDIVDEVAVGAVHSLHPTEAERPTKPPPFPTMPKPPPRGFEGPRKTLTALTALVVPSVRGSRPDAEPTDEHTLIGSPAPQSLPPMRSKLDSVDLRTDVLLEQYRLESEGRRAEASARLRAEGEALELRRALDAMRRAPPVILSAPAPDRKAWLHLAYSIGGGVVLLIGAATAWLGAHTAKVESKADNTEEKRAADKVVTAPLPEKVQAVERQSTDCQTWARLYADYDRQVFAKLGVIIPERPNALPSEPIKTQARVRRANTVTSAPILEVLTLPPPLP